MNELKPVRVVDMNEMINNAAKSFSEREKFRFKIQIMFGFFILLIGVFSTVLLYQDSISISIYMFTIILLMISSLFLRG